MPMRSAYTMMACHDLFVPCDDSACATAPVSPTTPSSSTILHMLRYAWPMANTCHRSGWVVCLLCLAIPAGRVICLWGGLGLGLLWCKGSWGYCVVKVVRLLWCKGGWATVGNLL